MKYAIGLTLYGNYFFETVIFAVNKAEEATSENTGFDFVKGVFDSKEEAENALAEINEIKKGIVVG